MKRKFCVLYIGYIFEYIIEKLKVEENLNVNVDEYSNIKNVIENEIFKRCFKSLLYCMNAERLEGRLLGESPEDRYTFFSETEYCIKAMKKTFPTIPEQLYEEMKGKYKYIVDIINKYKANKKSICQYFFKSDEEEIGEITNSGDWHNDQCVVVIKFQSGNKIVYKPTKGKNIEFLKGILNYFFDSEYTDNYDFIFEKYGVWVKFIEHQEVFDENQINNFYYNYGKIIYVAYLLGMNDMHYENLIACGEYPVITDVETVFSSYLFFDTHKFDYDAQYRAIREILYGVMTTGLIPIFSMTEYFGGDVSCLSNKGMRINAEKLKNEYRDDMYIYMSMKTIREYNHLPNKDMDPLFYGKSIVEGFKEAEHIFKQHKEEVTQYILDNLYKVEARIILNMTKGYSRIVQIKSDPRYRYNPQLFDGLLKNLKRANQFSEDVYEYEVGELCKSNIPSFYWNQNSNYVYGYQKDKMKKVLDMHEFTISKIKEIIEHQTSDNMIAKQRKLIKDSIVSSISLGIEYKGIDLEPIKEAIVNQEEVSLLDDIGRYGVKGEDGTINWIGLLVNDKEQLEYAVLDWSLYSGLIGIGYMYITEYLVNQTETSKEIIERIYHTIIKAYDCGTFNEYNISYFNGLTGIYSFLVKIQEHRILSKSSVNIYIDYIKKLIKNNLIKTDVYDTLSGIHSAVIYFYSYYEKDDFGKDMLSMLAEYFLTNFKLEMMEENFNYASFAHGYSGVMTSIMCLNKVSKNEAFATIIRALWEKESALHINEFMWQDLRSDKRMHSHFWCHGSCGIMFSRLIWKKYGFMKDDILDLTEIQLVNQLVQYKTSIEAEIFNSQNYSLCHGNFAFIDFILAYNKVFGEEVLENKYIAQVIDRAKKQGYSCIGAPGGINSIGFMVGESGIQYLLNRCRASEIPSVLAIEAI